MQKQQKYQGIKEKEIQKQVRDRPTLSVGTQRILRDKKTDNVFDRQRVLQYAKQAMNRQEIEASKYDKMQGITHKPHINQKSRSMQRTIDDLYNWQARKQNKLKAERIKTASPTKDTNSNRSISSKRQTSSIVENKMISQSIKSQIKKSQKSRQEERI